MYIIDVHTNAELNFTYLLNFSIKSETEIVAKYRPINRFINVTSYSIVVCSTYTLTMVTVIIP